MQLPLLSQIIIAALLALLGVVVLLKMRERRSAARERKASGKASLDRRKDKPQPTNAAPAPSQPQGMPAAGTEADGVGAAEIAEVDLLDEVEIYLSYGHLEQAAMSLRWYVDHHLEDTANIRRLLDLYLEIPDIEHYAELLGGLCERGMDGDGCRTRILAGLKIDPENLTLRVLAEAQLRMGIEEIDAELAKACPTQPRDIGIPEAFSPLARAQKALEQAIVNPEPLDLSGIYLGAFGGPAVAEAPTAPEMAGWSGEALPMVSGGGHLERLNKPETKIAEGFLPPSQAASLLEETGNMEEALRVLRRAAIFEPRRLALHTDILRLLHKTRRPEEYAEALLALYLTLWGAGTALRRRLLDLGRGLGEHPLWQALADAEGRERQLATLAEQRGLYVPVTAIPLSHPPLVEERLQSDHDIIPDGTDDPVLREFNQLLEYGQVEEAVSLLETIIDSQPGASQYFRPLLEMYERMDDEERFSSFIDRTFSKNSQPGEEVVRQMFDLAARMQRQGGLRAI